MMKSSALAMALLLSGAAVAQTTTQHKQNTAHTAAHSDANPDMKTTGHYGQPYVAGDRIVQAGNANPERDARGIRVISDPAVVPAGWNGVSATAMGGPQVDPATGETIDVGENEYPACTAAITDNCVQAYVRDRR